MKGKDLLDKMNFIENDLINQAANINKKRKRYKKWYAIAASLCVVLIGTLFYSNFNGNDKLDNNIDNVVDSDTNNDEKNSLVYIPKIELPKETNAQADMLGLFVYKGKVYTQAESFTGDEALKVKELVGKRIGYAKGNIDEWSKQDEYANEFAGSVQGDVYTVNGYDEDFRLCINGSYDDDNGEKVEYVHFYENLNGIGLNKGRDLFGDRLKIDQNYDYIKFLTHDNWNNGWPNYNYLDLPSVSKEDIDSFIDQLYKGEFVDLQGTNIYDKPSHHIYLYMKDNTKVELRLFEGGYVGYQPLGWCFVKMPGEIFDKFYEASK